MRGSHFGTRWPARAVQVATLAAASAVMLVGCGSSGGTSGDTGASTPTAASTAAGGATSGTSSTRSGATTSGTASAAATVAIKNAYAKFFAPNTPANVSLGLLQNGPAFKTAIDQQASGSLAAKATAKVSDVALVSPNTAEVTFTIYLNNKPTLPGQKGYAVKENGTWKVSEYTFCSLLTLQGSAPAECKQPAATEAPK